MTHRNPKRAPVIWCVVCTDVDGRRFIMGWCNNRHEARFDARVYRAKDHDQVILHVRRPRRYTVVKYIPAPGKGRK